MSARDATPGKALRAHVADGKRRIYVDVVGRCHQDDCGGWEVRTTGRVVGQDRAYFRDSDPLPDSRLAVPESDIEVVGWRWPWE
jgi:hypothetical protein